MTGFQRSCLVVCIVAGLVACNTEFNTDLDGDVPDTLDISTEAPGDGPPDVVPDGGPDCGNGDVDDGEQCDDGNDVDGDGCDNDCTYSCEGDGDCLDDNPCNGEEICSNEDHVCMEGAPLEDGHLIDVGPPRIICLEANPAESVCGDGFVDEGAGEFCEPPGEGACTDECVLGCTSDGDCPDDGLLCNGEEYCNAGLCDRRDVPDAGTPCDDEQFCTTDEACDGAGTCTGGDPTCDDDLTCTDNRCDETADACEYPMIAGNCLMDGVCYADHDLNPGNDCEECDSSREFSLWLAVTDGTSCADDGATCTTDVCTSGSCEHPITSGWCYMGGGCLMDGVRDSGNECLVCDSGVDATDWTIDVGFSCDDGDSCTTADACDSTGTCVGTPTSTFSGVTDLGDGMYHACALQGTSLSCWGYNMYGQLGNGSSSNSTTPVTPTGMSSVEDVDAGTSHTCAVMTSGSVRCWGRNNEGQLGNGTLTDSDVPVDVTGITNASQVCTGFYHSCVRLTSGQVRCWGRGSYGELGNGTTSDSSTPVSVWDTSYTGTSLGGVLRVECGNYHNCALLGMGTMVCWGLNSQGQLGNGSSGSPLSAPVYVRASDTDSAPLDNIDQIALGSLHTCARLDTGHVKCWGAGTNGQLGDGGIVSQDAPVYVMASISPAVMLVGVVDVAAGGNHTCARDSSGFALCWGQGDEGQLGDGISGSGHRQVLPQLVRTDSTGGLLSGTSLLSLGTQHTHAIAYSPDNVIGWGRNNYGQLGIGNTTTPQLYPVLVGCP